ncbi:MAG: hypothetical protein WD770_05860 [Actinomycetota bacterium]
MALPPPPPPVATPPPRVRSPRWFRVGVVLASIWMGLCLLISWISSLGVHCTEHACQSRADTGWAVLMLAQLAWIALAVVLWTRRSRIRYWGLAVAAGLPPLTLLAMTKLFYPPAFRL